MTSVLTALVVIVAALFVFVRWLEPRFAFFPTPGETTTPPEFGVRFEPATIATADGEMKPSTDFGDRSILIARGLAWSADSRFLYAAVAEYEMDIVLIDGLVR